MMMWFMDTIYKMVVSQHIYISYCTVQVLFHSGDLLNTSGCCRTSLPQGSRKIEMGQNWSSPAGEDPQAHDILLVLLSRGDMSWPVPLYTSTVSVLICCRYLSIYEADEPGPRTLEYMEEREYQVQPLLCGCWAFLHSLTDGSGRPKWHPILHHVPRLFPKFFQLVASFRTLWIYIYIYTIFINISPSFPCELNELHWSSFQLARGSWPQVTAEGIAIRTLPDERSPRTGEILRQGETFTAIEAVDGLDSDQRLRPGRGGGKKGGATRRKNWDDFFFGGRF